MSEQRAEQGPVAASTSLRGRIRLGAGIVAAALAVGQIGLQLALAAERNANTLWAAETALESRAERVLGASAHLDAAPPARRARALTELEAATAGLPGDPPIRSEAVDRLARAGERIAAAERRGDRSEVSREVEQLIQVHREWAVIHGTAIDEARQALDVRRGWVFVAAILEFVLSLGALLGVAVGLLRPRLARVDRTLRSLSRVQDSLRESEAQKDAMLRAIPDAIFRLTRNGEVLAATQSYSTDEPRIPTPLRDGINEACRHTVDERLPQELERQVGTSDRPRHVEVRVVPCGRTEALAIVRDVTERKRLEREVLEISDREQTRMGQDLHDGLCQHLAGVGLVTRTAASRAARGDTVTAEDLSKLGELMDTGLQLARAMSRGLYPAVLEQRGLRAALEDLCASTTTLHGVACEPQIEAEEDPPRAASLQLYRIAQEALANAIKHAKASHIVLRYLERDGRLELEVEDDGRGIDPARRDRNHTSMGLRIMRSRARVLGGELRIDSTEGEGTTITFAVSQDRRVGLDDGDANNDNMDDLAS